MDYLHIYPFLIIVFFILYWRVGLYSAALISSLIFVSSELLKAKRSDPTVWREFSRGVHLVGHRAGGDNAPENTIAGLETAHRNGAQTVEVDVVLTSDNEPVLFHDPTLDRTTDGTGYATSKTLAELEKLDAAHNHPKRDEFPNTKIPHLKDFLRRSKQLGSKIFLDVKYDPSYSTLDMVRALEKMTKDFPDLHKWAIVCSFYPNILYAVKWYMPQMTTILIHRPWSITYTSAEHNEYRNDALWFKTLAPLVDGAHHFMIYNFWWYICGCDAVSIDIDSYSLNERRYWTTRGLDVYVWTVNDESTKKYLRDQGVPYITDDVTS